MRHYPFDSSKVKLAGTNLIEASAGTGKTYSIAIMVLRLVLEEKLNVKQILMVTFTKAAVAELEERIRAFIRTAHRQSTGHRIEDDNIRSIVHNQIEKEGAENVKLRLQEAVLFLDESAVMTIHGFCQQTLIEFAFETGQVFGAETLDDPAILIEEQVNKFWRKHVTTMPVSLLTSLSTGGFSRSSLINLIRQHLAGKHYLSYAEGKSYDCTGDQHIQWMNELKELGEKKQALNESLIYFISTNRERLLEQSEKDHNAKKTIPGLLDNMQDLLKKFNDKKKQPGYIPKLFPDILALCSDCEKAEKEVNLQYVKILSHLYCMAITEVSKAVEEVKQRKNLLAFDDMIAKVHAALTIRPNPRLVQALQQKYKAVFIDEFQDTDKQQYEIFETAFKTNTIVFYIGDPKQSIYAWRTADLQTYFNARNSVDSVYDMHINFRSAISYIKAMNEFFKVDDPFYFNDKPDGIEYIQVEAPRESSKGILLFGKEAVIPITIGIGDNKEHIQSGLVAEVIRLLNGGYQILKNKEQRSITPSDIGILVRANREGADIKWQLARFGIPAVTIGDEKVLDSEEAKMVWHFLIAMEEPVRGNINRALITPLTGYDADSVLLFKEELLTDMFRNYRKTWEESGIYTAMMNLVEGFNIRGHLLSGNIEQGERSITNLFQLIELIHKVQVRQNFSTLELIAWLKRAIDGMSNQGDEYEQRVESDEDSVKIVTIHKSKGLEYNIVLCPSLDQVNEYKENDIASFRDPDRNKYVSDEWKKLSPSHQILVEEQQTQEKRRLIYVAITRAVYKCFIYKNGYAKVANKSNLNPFVIGLENESLLIELTAPPKQSETFRYRMDARHLPVPLQAPGFKLLEANWRKVSYSSLAAKNQSRIKSTLGGHVETYDRFMFYQLAKGAHTGNMLHFIFENVNFSNDSNWGYIIDKAITQFAPNKRENYMPLLRHLLDTIMYVPIRINNRVFTLSEVENGSKIQEFEFDFTIDRLIPADLNSLSTESISIAVKEQSEMMGLMNGLIDLVFIHKGKYYILDWKSNYLGDQLDDYSQAQLAEAMNENNYHLQYLLYTLAIRKYLQSRLGDGFDFKKQFGGVIYLFVRGIRKNKQYGIFTTVPSAELLKALDARLTNSEKSQLSLFS